MDLERLAMFVRVAEQGSFTAAARTLGAQKSSVSRMVAQLEAELGVALVRRTTRKVSLTDAGRRYLDGARRALATLEETRAEIMRADREPEGLVRLTAPADIPGPLLAAPLAELARRHPRITLDVMLTNRRVDLIAEGVDLALRAGPIADSSLVVKRVGDDTVELYAAVGYLDRRGRPKRLADLAAHDCVLFRAGPGMRARWTLTGPRGRASIEVRGQLNGDAMQFVADAIEAGAGIGLLPTATAHRMVRLHKIERVLPGYAVTGGSLHLVHAPVRHLPHRVALVRDFLWKELRERLAACASL
jgi:DNA-binding transcriptional LysR family regulator